LIARFENDRDIAWRGYALALGHKHVPEMQQRCGLSVPPLFTPAVIPAHRGMVVEVPLPLSAMPGAGTPEAMREWLANFYAASPVVRMGVPPADGELLLRASREPHDGMELFVFANADGSQARLVAVLDNLGKGASGAAVQSLNLMAGLPETAGLRLENACRCLEFRHGPVQLSAIARRPGAAILPRGRPCGTYRCESALSCTGAILYFRMRRIGMILEKETAGGQRPSDRQCRERASWGPDEKD